MSVDDFDTEIEDIAVDDEAADAQPPKKSRSLLMTVILIVVAIGGGFFAVNSLGLLSLLKPSQEVDSPVVVVPMDPPSTMGAAAPAPVLDATAALNAPVAGDAADVLAAPVDAGASPVSAVEEPMPEQPLETVQTPAAAPEPISAPAVSDPSADPLAWNTESGGTPPAAAPVAETAPVVQAAPEEAAPAPVEVVSDQTAASSAPAPLEMPVVQSQDDGVLQGRVEALEQKLSVLQQNLDTLNENMPAKSDIEAIKKTLARLESRADKTPAAPMTARSDEEERAAEIKPVVKKKKPAVFVQPAQWMLKSAKPGEAWIVPRNGGELKSVAVGDEVAGIGKITSITQDSNGRWIVNGTKGKINQ